MAKEPDYVPTARSGKKFSVGQSQRFRPYVGEDKDERKVDESSLKGASKALYRRPGTSESVSAPDYPELKGGTVASAGAGAEKMPGPPKSKPKSASTGSTREYPKPKARPSGSDDRSSPFKERDEGMVNYAKRFEGSDHG